MMRLLLTWIIATLLLVRDASSSTSLGMEMNRFAPVCDANNETIKSNYTKPTYDDLIQWIQDNSGTVDDCQGIRQGRAYATAFIPKGTTLVSVPWKIIMEARDVCDLVTLVHKELNQTSEYGPYMSHLNSRMMEDVKDSEQASHAEMSFASWQTKCEGKSNPVDDELKRAALLVSRYFHSTYGYYEMIPFRDFYSIKPLESNIRLVEDEDEEITTFVASQDINAGESLYLSRVPDKFWTWRRKKIKNYLNCGAVNQAPRPIHSKEIWVYLRRLYRQIVGPEQSTILENDHVDGFDGVPIEGRYSPGKGRGIFATGFIPKNTRVWTLMHQSGRFRDGDSYRKLLASVPPDMACDLLKFGYIEDMGEDDQLDLALRVDFDEASYTNTAGWDDGVVSNIGCPPELEGSDDCEYNEYALRDIHAGEEILSDYKDFAIPDAWESFGL